MIRPEQADQVADSILDQARTALEEKQEKRSIRERAARLRRHSPLIPAFISAGTVYVAMDYTQNVYVCVVLGTVVGFIFSWAARKSSF